MSRVLGQFISIAAFQFQRCDDKIAEFPARPWMYNMYYMDVECDNGGIKHGQQADTHV